LWKAGLLAVRTGGGTMRMKVLLQITNDDGNDGAAAEVAAFEKVTERPEDLGLSIAEAKALLAAVQQQTVDAQVACWMKRHRCCETCGQHRRSKGSHRVVFLRVRLESQLERASRLVSSMTQAA